jgi:hypothetical protein
VGRLKRLAAAKLDLVLDRFETFEATTDDALAGCLEVLDRVRREELNRVAGASAVASHAFEGQEVDQRIHGCRDTRDGTIVACTIATPATTLAPIGSSREEYRLDAFPPPMLADLVVLTRLAVLPAYRGSVASLSLITGFLTGLMEEGRRAALLACEPGLVAMYTRLGARPIGPVRSSPSGGFRLPMICIPDPAHLAAVNSPLRKALERAGGAELHGPVTDWYEELVRREGRIRTGVNGYRWREEGDADHEQLTAGLSAEATGQLLRHAQVVTCQPGHLIVAADDGGRFLGLVRTGAVEVRRDGATVAVLGAGEVFGELAVILDARRSADVLAAGVETEVVLLTRSAIDHVTDPRDRAVLWENLARIVARRLVAAG